MAGEIEAPRGSTTFHHRHTDHEDEFLTPALVVAIGLVLGLMAFRLGG
jgi:hypothetical protein